MRSSIKSAVTEAPDGQEVAERHGDFDSDKEGRNGRPDEAKAGDAFGELTV